jgi:hypothetical protein
LFETKECKQNTCMSRTDLTASLKCANYYKKYIYKYKKIFCIDIQLSTLVEIGITRNYVRTRTPPSGCHV